jgi:hypothetical protein
MKAIRLYRVICRQPIFPYSNITQWITDLPRTLPLAAYHEAEIAHSLTHDTVLTNALRLSFQTQNMHYFKLGVTATGM